MDNKNITTEDYPRGYQDEKGVVAVYKINDQSGEVSKHFLLPLRNEEKNYHLFQASNNPVITVYNNKMILELVFNIKNNGKKKRKNILLEIPLP